MIQKIKGTYDVYGELGNKHQYIKSLFENVCENFNYGYIETPLIERSELFHRGVGETSDIVTKETYDFVDRGGRNNTIRPEGTAGVARAIIENKLYTTLPLKFYYMGSMFRYERPQKGRYRELRQLGVEVYGSNDEITDVETINLATTFFRELGLKDVTVKINSIGGVETRKKYREDLIKYFNKNIDSYCEDCKARLNKNPLRILDCKIDGEKEEVKKAPSILDYLNEDEKESFEKIKKYLDNLEIKYEVDDRLVRGLDYYTNLVYEFTTPFKDIGSIGGGGRYNNLLSSLEGPEVPAVGFAFGFDRIVDVINELDLPILKDSNLDVYVLNIDEKEYAFNLVNMLRQNGFKTDMNLTDKNMKSQFKEADRYNSKFVIIVGSDEVKNNILTVRDNLTKEEVKVDYDNLIDYLDINV